MVQALQFISGSMWLVPTALFSPVFVRIARGRADLPDLCVSILPMIGFMLAGFSLRWRLFHDTIAAMVPTELIMWSGLYVMSGMLSCFAVFIFTKWWGRA